jgi:hypothetical protein
MLILFTKESQEDTKEMKWKIQETENEIIDYDKRIKN